MNASWYDLAIWLNANSTLTLGTNLFGGEWGKPDSQVLVLEGIGTPSDLKDVYEQIGVQVMVRGERGVTSNESYKLIKEVSDLMLTSGESIIMNGCEYKGFEQESNIASLGMDENQRHIWTANFYSYRKGAA